MRKTIRFIAPIVAAASIAASPIASAETHLQCTNPSANSTQCENPGNVQLTSTPGTIATYPQYPYYYGHRHFDAGRPLGGGGSHGGGGGNGGSHSGGGHG